jgi:hypothetical protein
MVGGSFGTEAKYVTLAIGLDDAVVRQVDLPQIPMDEMRLVLKNNTKTYTCSRICPVTFSIATFFRPSKRHRASPRETAKFAGVPKLKVLVAARSSNW